MHMVDALVSPVVGGTMWAAASSAGVFAFNKLPKEETERKISEMGVMGAFVFAAQMINFAIPGTGASGHISGGLLLSILLGPTAAYLTMGMVLLIQALFFADGGILAFGANWINMGFITCFAIYPLIYRPLMNYFNKRNTMTGTKEKVIITCSAIIGLQFGSLGVVFMTYLSHTTSISLITFLGFMQPIHLAIGLVEGIITALAIAFIRQHEPGLIYCTYPIHRQKPTNKKMITFTLAIAGILVYIASSNPDGLEWALEKIQFAQASYHTIQSPLAFLSDYQIPEKIEKVIPVDTTGLVGVIGVSIMLAIGFVFNKLYLRRQNDGSNDHE